MRDHEKVFTDILNLQTQQEISSPIIEILRFFKNVHIDLLTVTYTNTPSRQKSYKIKQLPWLLTPSPTPHVEYASFHHGVDLGEKRK